MSLRFAGASGGQEGPEMIRRTSTKEGNHLNWVISVIIFSGLVAPLTASGQSPAAPANSHPASSNEKLNIDAYIKLLRSDVRKDKSQIIGQVMQFDTDQSAIFWPIYKDFQGELTQNGDQVVALVTKYAENYDNMTDAVADQLATKLLDIEQQRNALKRKYYERFKTALDAITAARFLQVENQIEKVIDLQIASRLPVISATGK